eukprot:gene11365-23785_t
MTKIHFLHGFKSQSWFRPEEDNLDCNHRVTFYVSLKLNDIEDLRDELLYISDPESESYGKHLSIEAINHKYGPSVEQQTVVMEHFRGIHGSVVESNLHGDMIRVQASVEHIEKGLDTSLGCLNSPVLHASRSLPRSKSNEIPSSPHTHQVTATATATATAAAGVYSSHTTISKLKFLYAVPWSNHGLGSQSVTEFYGEMFSNTDSSIFFEKYLSESDIDKDKSYIDINNIYGDVKNDESRQGIEATLDIQYLLGMAPGISTYVYSMGGLNPMSLQNEGFLAYLWTVGSQFHPPLVHSLSYGDTESSVFDPNSPGAIEYGNRVELEFAKMGLRGLTVIAASGDAGVCGNGAPSDSCARPSPIWPASSPYVTAVGATQQINSDDNVSGDDINGGEVVCSICTGAGITSGGGFSDIHKRNKAPWQENVVRTYLDRNNDDIPPMNNFNVEGRGYPDVALLGNDYEIVLAGGVATVSGTSASTPVFAGIISLLNDKRLSRGMSPLGFVNPFLYWAYKKDSTAFTDITNGDNSCTCEEVGEVKEECTNKFSAAPGWDAATGLGSPRFDRLSALLELI